MGNLTNETDSADNRSLSDQLLLAMFWEENLFNNIGQLGEAPVGFGQMHFRMHEIRTHQRTNA
jgi:hypothetical protein